MSRRLFWDWFTPEYDDDELECGPLDADYWDEADDENPDLYDQLSYMLDHDDAD